MTRSPPPVVVIVKLALYYALLVAAFLGLERILPAGPSAALRTALATLGGLALAIPVAWVYRLSKPPADLDVPLLQTVIVLPVAVSGIVLIVENSLALAFSLAGIVAAVRFRNTLRDTKDAVYVFVAIGLGLAAGVQQLAVGLVLSAVFAAVMLGLWRLDPGTPDAGSGMLLVDVSSTLAVRRAVEGALEKHTDQWKLVHTTPGAGDRATLAYLVRLRPKTPPPALVEAVRRAEPDVASADFEALEA